MNVEQQIGIKRIVSKLCAAHNIITKYYDIDFFNFVPSRHNGMVIVLPIVDYKKLFDIYEVCGFEYAFDDIDFRVNVLLIRYYPLYYYTYLTIYAMLYKESVNINYFNIINFDIRIVRKLMRETCRR